MNNQRQKKTRIIATIGPASDTETTMRQLFDAGVNVVRMNFSHGDHAEHKKRLDHIHQAIEKNKSDVAILQDLGGVKIRIGDFVGGEIVLKKNQQFVLTTQKCNGTEERVYINYKNLPQEITVGQLVLLDDGTKKIKVTDIKDTEIYTRVMVGGCIRSRRGVNIPGARLQCDALTQKDKKDVIEFGIKNNIDFIALSFVRHKKDIMQLRRILKKYHSSAHIIAKIETPEAIEAIDDIISVADGIMVARGDLAVEVPASDVPHLQKMIVKKCNIAGKPVIVATQMLESMIKTPVPTRAEVTDVANAVLDGADGVMLSAESAIGEYPVHAVKMMTEIVQRTEQDIFPRINHSNDIMSVVDAVSLTAIETAQRVGAKVIVALTESGFTARHIVRYRPFQKVIVLTPHEVTKKQLQLSYGCFAHIIMQQEKMSDTIVLSKEVIEKNKYCVKGDRIVIVAGIPFDRSGTTNTIVVKEI